MKSFFLVYLIFIFTGGIAQPVLRFSPSVVEFDAVYIDSVSGKNTYDFTTETKAVWIYNKGDQPLIVHGLRWPKDYCPLTASNLQPVYPGDSAFFTVYCAAIRNNINGLITFESNDPYMPVVNVPVRGIVIENEKVRFPESTGKGILQFEQPVIDIDTVYMNNDRIWDTITIDSDTKYRLDNKHQTIIVDYGYTNTGTGPLVITASYGSGRAFAEYSKEPLMPGESGTLKVYYYGFHPGQQDFIRTITLQGNFEGGIKHIKLKGYIKDR